MKTLSAIVLCFAASCFAQTPTPTVQVMNMSSQSAMRQVLPFANVQPFVEVFIYGDGTSQKYDATLTYTDFQGKQFVVTATFNAAAAGPTAYAFWVDAASASVVVKGYIASGVVLQSR